LSYCNSNFLPLLIFSNKRSMFPLECVSLYILSLSLSLSLSLGASFFQFAIVFREWRSSDATCFLCATTRASRNESTRVLETSFLAARSSSLSVLELAWALHGGSWLLFQAAAAAAAATPLLKTPLSTAQQATYAAAATYTAVAARAYGAAAAAAQPVAGYAAVAG